MKLTNLQRVVARLAVLFLHGSGRHAGLGQCTAD